MVLLSMTRSIKYMKDLLLRVGRPRLIQAISEATNNIFRCVTSPLCFNTGDILFHKVYIIGKTLNGESILVTMVTVANEAHFDLEFALAVIDDISHNLFEGILGSADPIAH
jgi:hypothetical protein